MALKEKQIQQNFRPIIAVHKWFARRPGTLFRGLILSEFAEAPLAESFFSANNFPGRLVADPFMGGGTPLLEANRVGCDVKGFDINPMATWIVREEIEHVDLEAYRRASLALNKSLRAEIGIAYQTDCPLFGERNVPVKYFLWVKTIDCERCSHPIDLFPSYLIADDTRHPKHVLACHSCGELNEVVERKRPGQCHHCKTELREYGPARRNRCPCFHCGHINTYPRPDIGPPRHRMFAIEYHNQHRRDEHRGRFFKLSWPHPESVSAKQSVPSGLVASIKRRILLCRTNSIPRSLLRPKSPRMMERHVTKSRACSISARCQCRVDLPMVRHDLKSLPASQVVDSESAVKI